MFKVAQRMDLILGALSLAAALYLVFVQDAYGLAAIVGLGSALSFASAKFMPAKWILRRLLLARTR